MLTTYKILCISALALYSTYFSFAQNSLDDLNAMPKTQRDIVVKWREFSEQLKKVSEIKNAVAKQEALQEYKKSRKSWLEGVNKTISSEGINDWVGKVKVTTADVIVDTELEKTNGSLYYLRVVIPVDNNLADGVRESIKKLNDNQFVKIAVSADPKGSPLFSDRYSLIGRVKSKNLLKISPQNSN